MADTSEIAKTLTYEYTSNLRLALQRTESRLSPYCEMLAGSGEGMRPTMNIGPTTYGKRTNRHEPIVIGEVAIDPRWVEPVVYNTPSRSEDSIDMVRNNVTLMGTYVQNDVAALNRAKDDEIIIALRAASKTGKNGSGTTAYDTNMDVAVTVGSGGGSTAVGLNADKLKRARKLLRANEVDLNEGVCVGVTADDIESLMNDPQITSSDYSTQRVLETGEIPGFHGFKFVHSEAFMDTSRYVSGDRALPFWVKSGITFCDWDALYVDIDRNKNMQGHPWVSYSEIKVGATRTDEKRVGHILVEP